ncbi:hypothetical protein NKR23_g7499 [Pleurostoma richardsiae]|uniref:Uncharacterized protein n=1 Tax=Pleurostoma richardsiae TaxID=41990 RepID=A0AA38RAI6_9PEZI|nr:hypothetical protein NKR23_g7499 [Pleurostoma richardsiae]
MPRHQQPLLSALIPCLLLALLLAALLPHPAAAQNSTEVTIYNASDKYAYYGCYNETTGLAGTSGARALSGGANEVGTGNMTVPICLGFCSSGGTEYKYAGIEYAR